MHGTLDGWEQDLHQRFHSGRLERVMISANKAVGYGTGVEKIALYRTDGSSGGQLAMCGNAVWQKRVLTAASAPPAVYMWERSVASKDIGSGVPITGCAHVATQ